MTLDPLRLLRRQPRPSTVDPLSRYARLVATALLVAAIVCGWPAAARADDDLPGRVGRVADVAGELFLAPQDKPDQWAPIGLNYPVTSGDNLWVGNDGRAEIDFGAGQFRLAGDTNLHLARLDDRQFALFVAQGRVYVRIRVLDPGESAQIDTPNAQLVLTRPGRYRIDVSADREHTQLAVREGEANVQTQGAVQQVLPGQAAAIDGTEPRYATVRNGIGTDGFDSWSADRDRRYERGRAASYVSRQMVGYADLDEHGTWDQVPEYGAVWYPAAVAADWAPYRNGYWVEVGNWGPTWVDYAPWGYAPFHYGRWAYIGGRWGWCPGAYVARPAWAPALVGWAGGPAWGASIAFGAPVYGWVPLAWGEPYRPWWGRCSRGCWERYNKPYAVNLAERSNAPPTRYVNWNAPGGITAVAGAAFIARKPIRENLVSVSGGMAASAPVLAGAPLVRSEPGRIPGRRPGDGAPPPASTFYPTAVKPAAVGGGIGALPAGTSAVAVPPATRPNRVAPTAAVPGSLAKPAPAPPSGAANPYQGGMGAPANAVLPATRPAPQSSGPGIGGAVVTAPPARVDMKPVMRGVAPGPAPSLAPVHPVGPPQVSAPPSPNLVRQAPPRPQGVPLPPTMAPQPAKPMAVPSAQVAAPPAALAPGAAPPANGGNIVRQGRPAPANAAPPGDKVLVR